jgi:integrase
LADVWGRRPVSQITRREIEDVVADARTKAIPGLRAANLDESENRARKAFAILSNYFSWLARRRYVDADVTTAIEAPMAPPARKRVLTGPELRWCWLAAESLPFPYGPLTRLLLLRGQRLTEVGGMRWSELNADASSWLIPSTLATPCGPDHGANEGARAEPRDFSSHPCHRYVWAPRRFAPFIASRARHHRCSSRPAPQIATAAKEEITIR